MIKRVPFGGLFTAVLITLLAGCQAGTNPPVQSAPPAVAPPPASSQLDLIHPLTFGRKDGRAAVVGCSERIVEVPFVHRHLPYPFRGRLLDVGYLESEVIYQAASLGFDTWGIDIRPPAAEFPGVHYIQGDVIQYAFEPRSFDVVIGLSTVEHIGLHAYGNTAADPQGDLHALQAIHRALKPTGRLILTVPFGRRGAADWERIYDHASLLARLRAAAFSLQTEEYWTKEGDVRWVPTPWREAERVDSVSHGALAVACVVARPLP